MRRFNAQRLFCHKKKHYALKMLAKERKRLEKQERGGDRTKRGRGKKVASYNEDLLAAAGDESSGGSGSDSDASAGGSRPFFEDSDSGYSDGIDESSDDEDVSAVFCVALPP